MPRDLSRPEVQGLQRAVNVLDPTSHWQKATTLRLRFLQQDAFYPQEVDLSELRFSATP